VIITKPPQGIRDLRDLTATSARHASDEWVVGFNELREFPLFEVINSYLSVLHLVLF
jgi:hypothetical protein